MKKLLIAIVAILIANNSYASGCKVKVESYKKSLEYIKKHGDRDSRKKAKKQLLTLKRVRKKQDDCLTAKSIGKKFESDLNAIGSKVKNLGNLLEKLNKKTKSKDEKL